MSLSSEKQGSSALFLFSKTDISLFYYQHPWLYWRCCIYYNIMWLFIPQDLADVWDCVLISRHYKTHLVSQRNLYPFVELLLVLHCDWLSYFRVMRLMMRLAGRDSINHCTLSSIFHLISLFAFCAGAPKIAGVHGDTHTVHALKTTLHLLSHLQN